jgi:3-deoxy-D-manno-octulosonic-acid transferase
LLNKQHRILIIDHVGSLKYLYKHADLAIIGGGFNRIGIHNIIEPAVYGLETLFGPNHRGYQEALDLIAMKAAFVFCDANELFELIVNRINTSFSRKNRRKDSIQYVLNHVTDSATVSKDIVEKFRNLVLKTKQ